MTDRYVIAIDGPSGVGKTSVSRAVARRLAIAHLDTGAFYRVAAITSLVNRVDLRIEADVVSAVGRADFEYVDGLMLLEGIDMTDAIRSDVVTQASSQVAAYPSVRNILVDRQREWVEQRGGRAVVEGRDIGTVVFPEARLKVYLTARPEVRATRRADESATTSVVDVQEDMAERDEADSTRSASPLTVADDAVEVDTSDLGRQDVIDRVLMLVAKQGPVPGESPRTGLKNSRSKRNPQ